MDMVDNYKMIESKKFMWDGLTYETEKEAEETRSRYEGDGFEAELLEEAGKYLVYTRRVVTEIVLDGVAPP
jgi:hypothetical protein